MQRNAMAEENEVNDQGRERIEPMSYRETMSILFG